MLQAGGQRVVFTGDSTGGGEAAAGAGLARGPPVDVLKVAHHGSRSSTSAGFVGGARPRIAVISVGGNSYGHPADETVQRLRRAGARVYCTRKNGSVTLTVTGRGTIRWSFTGSAAPLVRGAREGGTRGGGRSTFSPQVEATMRRLKAGVPVAPISLSQRGNHISCSRAAVMSPRSMHLLPAEPALEQFAVDPVLGLLVVAGHEHRRRFGQLSRVDHDLGVRWCSAA